MATVHLTENRAQGGLNGWFPRACPGPGAELVQGPSRWVLTVPLGGSYNVLCRQVTKWEAHGGKSKT